MEKLQIQVSWSGKNYCCAWSSPGLGAVVCTHATLPGLKQEFEQALRFHVQGAISDGDKLPDWLIASDYELDFMLDTAALLRQAERFTTLSAISRACGIHIKQLSHYANGLKTPRAAQRERILQGLQLIGREVIALH